MSSNASDPTPPRPGNFNTMRSWLMGMVESLKPNEGGPDPDRPAPAGNGPSASGPGPEPAPAAVPLALPAELPTPPAPEKVQNYASLAAAPAPVPVAEPVPEAVPAEAPLPTAEPPVAEAVPTVEPAPPPPPQPCPICATPRAGGSYCDGCGYYFPPDAAPAPVVVGAPVAEVVPVAAAPAVRVRERYELGERVSERAGVERFRALDHGAGPSPVPVVLVRAVPPVAVEALPVATPVNLEEVPPAIFESPTTEEEITVGFDSPSASPSTDPIDGSQAWPGLGWERNVLKAANHPFLPTILDEFSDGGFDYLIEEVPAGRVLWDAWDDLDVTQEQRYTWLRHVAEQLHALHQAGAMPESLRPDVIVVTDDGRGRIADLSDLLPLPLPEDVPIRGSLYTAPELLAFHPHADARANLYSFGAMLYALHVGRELTEMDFDRPGQPKPFIPRFPDIHPAFGRLMMKTFTREPHARFPSDEAAKIDATGFTELIHTLEVCARTLDTARLEIASWTTTGMVRTGNEDAFALLHACESRQDDVGECALVLLADGMGGYEAGEVAAALAIQALRRNLMQQKPFAALAGASVFPTEVPRSEGNPPIALDVEQAKKLIHAALKDANRHVFQASRSGIGRRGMGCTAEVVYVDGRNVVVGHVGDSRTYHLHDGRLIQMTRDQTLVNRLVELGTLTAEEAETHPRRNELQQAVGGQPDVEPGIYHGTLKPGDWVVVCSDGLSNHVKDRELKQMLQSEAMGAEMAARRLVNLVNIEGATDNATVVVIRAT